MITNSTKHRVIPVRFSPEDLQKLEARAESLRLSIASYVRMEIGSMLSKDISTAQK